MAQVPTNWKVSTMNHPMHLGECQTPSSPDPRLTSPGGSGLPTRLIHKYGSILFLMRACLSASSRFLPASASMTRRISSRFSLDSLDSVGSGEAASLADSSSTCASMDSADSLHAASRDSLRMAARK